MSIMRQRNSKKYFLEYAKENRYLIFLDSILSLFKNISKYISLDKKNFRFDFKNTYFLSVRSDLLQHTSENAVLINSIYYIHKNLL